MHYITLHTYIHTLPNITLQYRPLHYHTDIPLHTYIHTLHYISLHSIPFHYSTLHYIALHCIHTLRYIPSHFKASHYIHILIHTLNTYITYIHYIHTLHYITTHCITVQHTTLHYVTLHYIHTHDGGSGPASGKVRRRPETPDGMSNSFCASSQRDTLRQSRMHRDDNAKGASLQVSSQKKRWSFCPTATGILKLLDPLKGSGSFLERCGPQVGLFEVPGCLDVSSC